VILSPTTLDELGECLADVRRSQARIGNLDLSAFQAIRHVPEDMTVTVEAGVTLAQLQSVLGSRGQWLPLDPWPDGITIRELIDANAHGPRREGYGTVRDYLIGLRVALADGRLIRSGGQVVKNVAGYDLMKLFIGARGSLGVVVEATFKVLPTPAVEIVLKKPCGHLREAFEALKTLRESRVTPVILDVTRMGNEFLAFAGFAGSRPAVDWQRERALSLGFPEESSVNYFREFFAASNKSLARSSVLPSRLCEFWEAVHPSQALAHAGVGVLWHDGQTPTPARSAGADALARRIKQAFDPAGVFGEIP
jgi:FAD/FMN-containing dehydrogenase